MASHQKKSIFYKKSVYHFYSHLSVKTPRRHIDARMGCYSGVKIMPAMQKLINSTIAQGEKWIVPRGALLDLNIKKIDRKSIIFKEVDWKITSNSITDLLRNCKKATLLGCTIGPQIERKTRMLMKKGHAAESFILDSFGSEAAEEIAQELTRKLAKRAAQKGFCLTFRFACGYGDWKLTDQRKIIALLCGGKLGIKVTKSLILDPQKSITAIIGWIPKGGKKKPLKLTKE